MRDRPRHMTLLPFRAVEATRPSTLSAEEKLALIEREVNAAIKKKMTDLHRSAHEMGSNMVTLTHRLRWEGSEAQFDDLRTGNFHKTMSELKAYKKVADLIASINGTRAENQMPDREEEDE